LQVENLPKAPLPKAQMDLIPTGGDGLKAEQKEEFALVTSQGAGD
jgi:hypothetical protein